jgi:protein-tyrosine phosphatase
MIKQDIKIFLKNAYWWIYGGEISNPPFPAYIKSVLFICKGNICRSAFSEMISEFKHNTSKRYSIHSAGILVDEPISPPVEAIAAANEFRVDMGTHKSRRMSYKLMETVDMILVMEAWQYKYLRKLFMEFDDKIFLLPLLEEENRRIVGSYSKYNIRDPYGKSVPEFIECYNRIEYCTDRLFSMIRKINNESD